MDDYGGIHTVGRNTVVQHLNVEPVRPSALAAALPACDHVRRRLPGLVVVETTRPMGSPHVVDPRRLEVWVDGTLPPAAARDALLDGLAVLCAHHDIPAPPPPGRHLSLVPALPRRAELGGLRSGTGL